jgi:hypothetical protein
MKKIFFVILIAGFLSTALFSTRRSTIIPDSSLRNVNIPDVPPVKIYGFTLGMLKERFITMLNKKYRTEKIRVLLLKPSAPELVVYKVDTQTIEHLVFYVYGNLLGKIQVVNLRPFDYPENILNRFLLRYGRFDNFWEQSSPEFIDRGYHWKRYTWNHNYRYTPDFNSTWLDIPINIVIDLNMQERFVSRVVYEYTIEPEYLRVHFNTHFDW